MNIGWKFLEGIFFGAGLIIVSFLMKALLHISLCG